MAARRAIRPDILVRNARQRPIVADPAHQPLADRLVVVGLRPCMHAVTCQWETADRASLETPPPFPLPECSRGPDCARDSGIARGGGPPPRTNSQEKYHSC